MKPLIEDEGAKGTLTFFCKHCNERMELAVNREMYGIGLFHHRQG